MKKYTILLGFGLLLLIEISGYAQDLRSWEWINQMGGKSLDVTCGMVSDNKGNLYITGNFFDTISSNKSQVISRGDQDFFVGKFENNGKSKGLWSGGGEGRDQVNCIAVTKDNNVIIGGLLTKDAEFEKSPFNNNANNLFILSLHDNGKINWQKLISFSDNASIQYVVSDENGDIYAAGSFTGELKSENFKVNSHGRKDIFLMRVDINGKTIMLASLGGEDDDIPTALSVGNHFLSFSCNIKRTFTIGNFVLKANENKKFSAFIVSYDKSFVPQLVSPVIFEQTGKISSLVQDRSNNIYVTGSFSSRMAISDTSFTSNGYTDGFIIKLDPFGNRIWGRSFGTWYYDNATRLIPDNLGGAILTGTIGDTLLLDNCIINPHSDHSSALILQFSEDGQVIWGDCITGSGQNFGDGATLDPKGNLYLSGSFSGLFEKGTASFQSHGDQDVFIARYQNCKEDDAEISGETNICPGESTILSVGKKYENVVWIDSIHGQKYLNINNPGKYWVSMMNKKGCVLEDTIDILQDPPSDFSLGADIMTPVGTKVELKIPSYLSDLRWQDNSSDQIYTIQSDKPSLFICSLTALDSLGCKVNDSINVEFYKNLAWADPSNLELSTYPNPVKNDLYWNLNVNSPCQVFVELTDVSGITIYKELIENYIPGSTEKIDFSEIPYGTYFLQFKNLSGQSSKSICLVKQ